MGIRTFVVTAVVALPAAVHAQAPPVEDRQVLLDTMDLSIEVPGDWVHEITADGDRFTMPDNLYAYVGVSAQPEPCADHPVRVNQIDFRAGIDNWVTLPWIRRDDLPDGWWTARDGTANFYCHDTRTGGAVEVFQGVLAQPDRGLLLLAAVDRALRAGGHLATAPTVPTVPTEPEAAVDDNARPSPERRRSGILRRLAPEQLDFGAAHMGSAGGDDGWGGSLAIARRTWRGETGLTYGYRGRISGRTWGHAEGELQVGVAVAHGLLGLYGLVGADAILGDGPELEDAAHGGVGGEVLFPTGEQTLLDVAVSRRWALGADRAETHLDARLLIVLDRNRATSLGISRVGFSEGAGAVWIFSVGWIRIDLDD